MFESIKGKEILMSDICPAFKTNNIPVLFSTNNSYVPYFSVAIKSLIENTSSENNYDIIILSQDLTDISKRKLLMLIDRRSNISIRFFNMKSYISSVNQTFFLNSYLPIETYYKFFLPEIMQAYDKCLYFDGDIVIEEDIAQLYNVDIGNKMLGASLNVANISDNHIRPHSKIIGDYTRKEYFENLLKMKNPNKYFQAGVLICNLQKMRQTNYTQQCLDTLNKIKTPRFFDQCVLNSLYSEDYYCFSTKWNHVWYIQNPDTISGTIPDSLYEDYLQGRQKPKIIHYASAQKPYHKPEWILAEYFWKYARLTPYYESLFNQTFYKEKVSSITSKEILEREILKDVIKKEQKRIKKRYNKYRFLSNFVFGKLRIKFLKKKKRNAEKLKTIIKLLGAKK